MRQPVVRILSLLILSTCSALALAQGGSLSYGPVGVVAAAAPAVNASPVPVNDVVLLILMGLMLSVVGAWALRRGNAGRTLGITLLAAGSLSLAGGLFQSSEVGAPPSVTQLSLAAGGSVPVFEGPQRFDNTSGVAISINGLTDPCGGGVENSAGSAACAVDKVLANNEGCNTDYACPQPEVCNGIDDNLNGLIDDGVTPPPGSSCDGDGVQVCTGLGGWACPPSCSADCSGKSCGDDGCGGSCGVCSDESTCIEGACINVPS